MNSKRYLLQKVIADRKLGMSLGDLSSKYKISKSTASLWCVDIKLSKKAKSLIEENWFKNTVSARYRGNIKNKQKRLDRIEKENEIARQVVGSLTKRDLLIMGISLYWAEGSKKETGSGFSFINSDHLMIKMMYEWLIKIMNINKELLTINLAVNIIHKEREIEILKFWSNLLDFPVEDFGNTTFIKTPLLRKYNNHNNYFGMLRIKVRSSAWLRRRILGMIKVFKEELPT